MSFSTVGPYQIIRKLGEGGMGAVYEAVHQTIERRVAIKILHPEYARHPESTARFFNEARAVNRIDHPSIVQISDYGHAADGTAYLVMEFLKGVSLGSRLKSGHLPLPYTLQIGLQVATALAAAHQRSIVHRDLKPDNVLPVEKMGQTFPRPRERSGESLPLSLLGPSATFVLVPAQCVLWLRVSWAMEAFEGDNAPLQQRR